MHLRKMWPVAYVLRVGAIILPMLLAAQITAAQVAKFKHIILMIQENRTPDNLFQGLCAPPFGGPGSCSTSPRSSQYNIQTSNWLNKNSPSGVTQPKPIPLNGTVDLFHSHGAFVTMCDANSNGVCRMDGAGDVGCKPPGCPTVRDPAFEFVDNSTGLLNPYLELATQYGFANRMFQTNQGPSFPAHQYLFGGTSAPTAEDDAAGVFAAENPSDPGVVLPPIGCIAPTTQTVQLISPSDPGEHQAIYPCFEHETVPDVLHSGATWRYYAPGVTGGLGIWVAPLAIDHVCRSSGPGGQCVGQDYVKHVDLVSTDILKDIANCNLASLTWVIPNGDASDHPSGPADWHGPSWVASVVNAVGNSTACDDGTGYWKDTAIIITWDDWGGWYDHVPPPILSSVQGDYERGFRVPLIVVSAYTRAHSISQRSLDFGSILRFVELNFRIVRGKLNFADARNTNGLTGFFTLATPRSYVPISAPLDADFFLNDKSLPTAPDDD